MVHNKKQRISKYLLTFPIDEFSVCDFIGYKFPKIQNPCSEYIIQTNVCHTPMYSQTPTYILNDRKMIDFSN